MAVVDYSVRLVSKFQCVAPGDAAPARKGEHLCDAAVGARAPHCEVALTLGTFGVTCERIDANHYQGHVPDAPVLLAKERAPIYRAGEMACGWGRRRVLATAGAAIIGALTGLAVAGAGLGVMALAHASAPSVFAPVKVIAAKQMAVFAPILGAAVVALFEVREWNALRLQLRELYSLCQHAQKPGAGSQSAVTAALSSKHWATQQAGLELEGILSTWV